MVRVLFVCMGNICRSPTAEGVFRYLVQQERLEEVIDIDSAGTHAYHVGDPPDQRAQSAALRRGIDISGQIARRVRPEDFLSFDYILAMDMENLQHLQSWCPPDQEHKLSLFLDFASDLEESEVPDPYYGGTSGFDRVLDMIEAASQQLLLHIRRKHLRQQPPDR